MTLKLEIKQATSPQDIAFVRALFLEYLQVLKTDFNNAVGCAVGEEDLLGFPEQYSALFLALKDNKSVAACGLKNLNSKDCELSKLYCRPEGRGLNVGRKITQACIDKARADKYDRLVLSTEPAMEHAGRLYASIGFEDVENYNCGQNGCSRFMAYDLSLRS